MGANRHTKLYKTVMADPPWDIQQKGGHGAIHHYNLMTLERIKAMPVADFMEPNAHCCSSVFLFDIMNSPFVSWF